MCIIHAGRSEGRATEAVDGWHDIAWKQFVLSAVITRRDNSMLNTAIEHFPILTSQSLQVPSIDAVAQY